MNKKTATLLLILFSISMASSQKVKHPIEIKNTQCHENAIPTTSSMIQCENEALKAWKKEMDVYLVLIEKNKIIDSLLLQEIQKKWLAFYKSDATFYNSYLNKLYQGGTLSRVSIITYKKKAIRKRALSLKDFYEDLE